MSFQKVKPTVPELDRLKKKKKFSLKGEKLLEIKREQVLTSLKKCIDDYFSQQKQIRELINKCFKIFERTYETIGKNKIESIAQLNHAYLKPSVDITYVNKFGIDMPKISYHIQDTTLPSYSFSDTSMYLDVLIKELKKLLPILLKLAELDNIMYRLAYNHQTVQRRINALDDILIPRLDKAILTIDEILSDSEREEFIRMKKIKEFLENKS